VNDDFIRRVLSATALMNAGAGLLFAFPSSTLGQLAGLPAEATPMYRGTVALFVVAFAGAYAWLARQPEIDRPLVGFAAIGKAAFFTLTLALWLFAAVPARLVLIATADLVFAALFIGWLMTPKAALKPGSRPSSA
jgi:hypothetical protein